MPKGVSKEEEKLAALQRRLRGLGRVIVAFSGGADSALLLRVAAETLGRENVLAVIGDSDSYPSRERAEAIRLAETMGVPYRVVQTTEGEDERYLANPTNRCYFCKSSLFTILSGTASAEGYAAVLDGANADDSDDWRPGRQAACDLGVCSPLAEVGLSKAEIRRLSHAYALPTADKPASACLASRIPYGTPITPEALASVEAAEDALHALGFRQVRVRHHEAVARIEVPPEEISRFLDPALRAEVTARLRAVGYRYVTLDLLGYRTGSLNEGVVPAETPRPGNGELASADRDG